MLSDLDRKIIIELQKDGRKSYSELSKMFGLSISTLRRRVNALLDKKVITITAIPDPAQVGYEVTTVIGFKVTRTELDHVVKEICKDACNHLVSVGTGPYDILSWSWFKNVGELSDYLINRIPRIPGIISTETSLSLKYAKRTYGWIGLDESDASAAPAAENNSDPILGEK
jgi:Lrp/AsnC family transcriptional regulator for asnA, asnC and gidA